MTEPLPPQSPEAPPAPAKPAGFLAWTATKRAAPMAAIGALLVSLMLVGLEVLAPRLDSRDRLDAAPGFYALAGALITAAALIAALGAGRLLAGASPKEASDDADA